MDNSNEKLIKMMKAEQLKRASALNLLSKLGYSYEEPTLDVTGGWVKEETFITDEDGQVIGLKLSGEGQ